MAIAAVNQAGQWVGINGVGFVVFAFGSLFMQNLLGLVECLFRNNRLMDAVEQLIMPWHFADVHRSFQNSIEGLNVPLFPAPPVTVFRRPAFSGQPAFVQFDADESRGAILTI
ncbi:hypothetical protein SDC9_122058 [bioreactor metagenome]|uniref:Uncharacterized protein n=1 Tax=bioreactor metagenome TaxID=1076179 RepID=A0A645CDP3_9ZZZZ